jgi:hypothetical protein
MAWRARFSTILEEKLTGVEPEPAVASTYTWRRPAVGPTVLYFDPRFYSTVDAPGTPMGSVAGEPMPTAFVRPVPLPRPRRVLTANQRQAFEALVGHGATLTVDFTDAELRTAFRILALRYHPDRHPGSNAVELRRLSAIFSTLTDAYRALLGTAHAVAA